jgi:hypothetical protein
MGIVVNCVGVIVEEEGSIGILKLDR